MHIDASVVRLYATNRARYERSGRRLLRAMEPGRSIVDTQIYKHREREHLDLYAEVLLPQGASSLLCASVHHRGRPVCQVFLKRHGRGATFRDRDAESLDGFLPALALADAGFQYSPALSWGDTDRVMCLETRPLGSREAEVALLVCKGLRNREIAMLFGTSCETVKKQVRSLFAKLGVSNRAELAGFLAGHRSS